MKRSIPLMALAVAAVACAPQEPQSDVAAATSCDGTTFFEDAGGRCHRADNGRFAPGVCCAVPDHPTARRSLASYSCPGDVDAVPVAFFDADSTLRVSKSGAPSANTANDVNVLPFAARTIRDFRDRGMLVAVVSNQGGVARGYLSPETAEAALVRTVELLHELGGDVDYLDFADAYDDNRKPKVGTEGGTGMAELLDAALKAKCGLSIDYDASVMIGDAGYKKGQDENHPWNDRPADDFSNSDRGFALNLGIPFYEPAQAEAFGWDAFGVYNLHNQWELLDFYELLEAEAETLEDDDPERAAMLAEEARRGRELNGLE